MTKAFHPSTVLDCLWIIHDKDYWDFASATTEIDGKHLDKFFDGQEDLTEQDAKVFAKHFDTTVDYWLNLQKLWDESDKH